ncbi:MAG TPA: DUF6788 family protein [Alphaproteobacteria bacterium]|nr:DUF6788 family protein [Alphaproteobacteria bacterium]
MPNSKSAAAALRQNFLRQLQSLWPPIKGSLAEVRKPCIRPNCPACARGDKHPVYILSFTDKGRRRCMYVPAEMVAQLQQALRNGRALEELLYQLGPELLRHYRQRRDSDEST